MISNVHVDELYQPIYRWNCFFHLKGRITDCHDGSGTKDSWSWNSSNFYHDDIMDITYTDPTYIPMYSLDGISQSLLQVNKLMCTNQSHNLDLLCDWSFNNIIWAIIVLFCCIAFIWTVLLFYALFRCDWTERFSSSFSLVWSQTKLDSARFICHCWKRGKSTATKV